MLVPAVGRKVEGLYRAKQIGDVSFFLFAYNISWYFGLLIVPKWLINDSGWIPIRFRTFLELPKLSLNLDPTIFLGTSVRHPNI